VSDHFIDYFDWQVSDITLESDHYVIQITAPSTQLHQQIVQPPRRRKFLKANWESYTKILHQKPLPQQVIEAWYQAFHLQDAANKSIPWTKPRKKI
jgi:hypothetical protein